MELFLDVESLTSFMEERLQAEGCDPCEILEQCETEAMNDGLRRERDPEIFNRVVTHHLLAWCEAH